MELSHGVGDGATWGRGGDRGCELSSTEARAKFLLRFIEIHGHFKAGLVALLGFLNGVEMPNG